MHCKVQDPIFATYLPVEAARVSLRSSKFEVQDFDFLLLR